MKIQIIGYSGSGKSTLARKLAEKYRVPVLHLDSVHFLPGWQIRSGEEKQRIVTEFLNANGDWIIDGNYSKLSYERRMEEADEIIRMEFGRLACLWRVIKRLHRYKNTARPDMAEGCGEKIDAEFVRWVLWEGRTRAIRKGRRALTEKYADKVTLIKNQRQLDRYCKLRGI